MRAFGRSAMTRGAGSPGAAVTRRGPVTFGTFRTFRTSFSPQEALITNVTAGADAPDEGQGGAQRRAPLPCSDPSRGAGHRNFSLFTLDRKSVV